MENDETGRKTRTERRAGQERKMRSFNERLRVVNFVLDILRSRVPAETFSEFKKDPIPHHRLRCPLLYDGSRLFSYDESEEFHLQEFPTGIFVSVFPDARVEFGYYEEAFPSIVDGKFYLEGEALISRAHPLFRRAFGDLKDVEDAQLKTLPR